MTSITQKINSLNGGISQQPDELKIPGQVVTAKNVFPDVTHGLQKRPGSQLVSSLSHGTNNSYTTGKWFSYYRDENEQYIGQVIRRSGHADNGKVRMWRCSDGFEMNVVGATAAITSYLQHTNDDEIQTLTLNDFTFINNRTKPTAMLTGATQVAPTKPFEAFIELKQVKYASQYGVDIYNSLATNDLVEVRTATRLGISYTLGTSGTNVQTGGQCDSVGTQLFEVSSGSNKKHLYFRITSTGQPTTTGGTSPNYVCRYTVKLDMLYGGLGWEKNDQQTVTMTNSAHNTNYVVKVEEASVTNIPANLCLARPKPTPFDNETTISANSILAQLRTEILDPANSDVDSGSTGFEVRQIGNGLYIKRTDAAFNISTPAPELLNVLTDEVQDVADLPKQCKHGYVVKVRNSANDEDDYYVKFFGLLKTGGDPDNDADYLDGDGVWEECNKPERRIAFDKSTMPIQLVRTSATQFTLGQVDYAPCGVGDQFTAPKPSFVSTVAGQDEDTVTASRTINKMLFFRNRLVFLSDENVIMSRPGDFFNFWPKSAIAASAEDPIDLSCSSEYPAHVFDGIQVNTGLVLFTKNQQFMLTTDSDVLSPLTAKINALATYNFNHRTNPINLGTTLAFLDNAGKFTRMFEMASVLREGEPVILEQSKVISRLFPKNINLVANSRENSFIVFAEKGGTSLYGFRYFTAGEKRIMQSWITWELSGNIQHICMLDDAVYAVVRNGTTDVMQKFNLKLSGEATETITNDNKVYRVYLDNISSVTTAGNTYNASTGKTTFPKPNGYDATHQLVGYDIDAGNDLGSYTPITVNGSNLEINGDWSGQTFLIGYLYEMEIEFPKFYVTKQAGDKFVSDVQSNLVIHRVKLNFGPLGAYDTKVKRVGKTDYDETHESTFADQYNANKLAIDTEQEVTVPIYERNINHTLILKSNKPTPATLYSLAWEGDYSNAFYKRV